MARNKEKIAFGIYKDGLKVKIAQLSLCNGFVSVQSLEETLLSSALFRQEVEDTDKSILPLDQQEDDIDFQELSGTEDETFSLPEISEFEDTEEFDDSTKDDNLPGLTDLQNFLQQFPLERGKLSFNANDEQISFFQFDSFAKFCLTLASNQSFLSFKLKAFAIMLSCMLRFLNCKILFSKLFLSKSITKSSREVTIPTLLTGNISLIFFQSR